MEASAALAWDQNPRAPSRKKIKLRPTATLIPVTLRLLDETGRHRIAERMLGILTEVSERGFQIRVVGPAGRPLSRGLARQQKVQITFLDTELHEKVESMACTLKSVRSGRQHDAWTVVLELPQLPLILKEELFAALERYEPERELHLPWRATALVALGGLLAVLAFRTGDAEPPRAAAAGAIAGAQEDRLERQLAYSTETIDRLAGQLEEADRAVQLRDEQIQGYEAEIEQLRRDAHTRPELVASTEATPPKAEPASTEADEARLRLRAASWKDFRTVLRIRGDQASPRLAYVDGVIELSEPSVTHRQVTRMLTRLLGAYAVARNLDLRALGPKTLASQTSRTGIEPEEVFSLASEATSAAPGRTAGPQTELPGVPDELPGEPDARPGLSDARPGLPDIVFDLVSKADEVEGLLESYRALGIREVWLRVGRNLSVHRLAEDGAYERSEWSGLLPELDVKLLGTLLERTDQTQATREFVRSLPR